MQIITTTLFFSNMKFFYYLFFGYFSFNSEIFGKKRVETLWNISQFFIVKPLKMFAHA
jgi:hypothetical protein